MRPLPSFSQKTFVALFVIAQIALAPDAALAKHTIVGVSDAKITNKNYLRGDNLQSFGEYGEALKYFDKAYSETNDIRVLKERGRCYCELGKYKEAIADHTYCIKKAGNSWASPYLYRGITYAKMGKHEDAIKDFTKGLDVETTTFRNKTSTLFDLRMERGRSYQALKDYKKAYDDYSQCIDMKPRSPDCGNIRIWRKRVHALMTAR